MSNREEKVTGALRVRRVLHVIAVVLSLAVVIALVQALRRDGPAARAAWRASVVRWPWVALATTCGLAGHAIYVIGWQRLLTDLGIRVSFWQLARFFLVSNLGRYLPGGKAWQMGIVGVMAAERGLPAAIVAATSLLQGTVGVAVGAILLLATGGATLGVAGSWYAVPIVAIAALLATPAWLKSQPRARAIVLRRLPGVEAVSVGTMWALVWTSTASWFGWGVALYSLARGLLPDAGASLITYVAAWTGPFLAGIIAVVTPAGLGVRDGVMQTMLAAAGVAPSVSMVLVVVTRVWATVLDIVPAVAVLAIRRYRGTSGSGGPTEPM